MRKFDPRTKLVMILAISLIALFCNDLRYLSAVLPVSVLLVLLLCGADCLRNALKKMKGIFLLFFSIAVIQSIFTAGEHALVQIGSVKLISLEGILLGALFLLRISAVMIAAVLIATEDSRNTIQALIQWRLPYEIAFMCALAVRFIPLFGQELRSSVISIQLRGVDLKRVPGGKRIHMYVSLLMPAVTGMIAKAKDMAVVMEMRGFRAYDQRTSYLTLKLRGGDYAVMALTVMGTAAVFACYGLGI